MNVCRRFPPFPMTPTPPMLRFTNLTWYLLPSLSINSSYLAFLGSEFFAMVGFESHCQLQNHGLIVFIATISGLFSSPVITEGVWNSESSTSQYIVMSGIFAKTLVMFRRIESCCQFQRFSSREILQPLITCCNVWFSLQNRHFEVVVIPPFDGVRAVC